MRKASIAYWQCRKAIGKTWGLKQKVVYWIYTSVIRPMLTCAALVWWKRTHLTTVNRTVWSYQADYLLEYDRLYEHHTYGSNAPSWVSPLHLMVEKESQASCIQITLLQPFQKIKLETFCYFQDGNERFLSFTGSFRQYATSGGI
jgi:hypothetical protein